MEYPFMCLYHFLVKIAIAETVGQPISNVDSLRCFCAFEAARLFVDSIALMSSSIFSALNIRSTTTSNPFA